MPAQGSAEKEATGTNARLRIALYQPDIPQNTGSILRTAACLGIAVDLIEPAGFRLDDAALRRAGLDYQERAALRRHANFEAFDGTRREDGRRLVLFTTKATTSAHAFAFDPTDTLLFGRESSGTPAYVHDRADARLRIAMRPDARSLNVAIAVAIAAFEALRQVGSLQSGDLSG